MSIYLQNYSYVQVYFNGMEVPITNSTVLELSIVQNILIKVPTLKLVLKDVTGATASDYPISDGMPITVLLGSGTSDDTPVACNFRQFGSPIGTGDSQAHLIILYAVLAAPKYLYGECKTAFTGTSASVLTSMATECSLLSSCDATSDTMTWLPMRKRWCDTAQFIAQHGWASNTSNMVLAVNEQGTLIYRNVTTAMVASPTVAIYINSPAPDSTSAITNIQAMDYSFSSLEAVSNAMGGYGSTTIQEAQDGSLEENMQVTATRLATKFGINSDIKGSITAMSSGAYGVTFTEYVPPDCGNTHTNYAMAINQNRRLQALFSIRTKVLVQAVTNLDLLDVANLVIYNPVTREADDTHSGVYVVTAKTRYISGNRYFEKLTLETTGRGSDPASLMV